MRTPSKANVLLIIINNVLTEIGVNLYFYATYESKIRKFRSIY